MKDQLIFQTLDWDFFHDEDNTGTKKFYMRMFGMTKSQETVYLQVEDFKPYFYFEMPSKWRKNHVSTFLEEIKKKVNWQVTEKNMKGSVEGMIDWKIEEKHKLYGFTNYKKFNFVKLVFNDYDSMKVYARVLGFTHRIPTLDRYPIKIKLYESNILPLLRFMHTRELEATGWMSVFYDKLEEFDENDVMPTCCKLNYKTKWTNVNKVEDRLIEKFIICSFDIECKSIDGSFPQFARDGDKIIQIGLTLSRFGENECYYKHLLSLKKTAPIEGATVESFETEEELLLAFTKIIRKLDPDIITGYNIFGFDFNYMMERAKKLKILSKFCRLSRITNEPSEWIRKDLSSAALGKNILTYYKMTGRVIIDLMKVVQRDHKLSSYKLDYVASYFIREEILEIIKMNETTFKIMTKKTDGLYVGQFLVVAYEESSVENKYNDGEKFQAIELGKDYIVVKGTIDTTEFMNKGYKVFWCQAKDDLPPSKIFELCDKTPEDRSIVGKYCIAEGTSITLTNTNVQIEKLTTNIGNSLYAYDETNKGLVLSDQEKFFDNGIAECVELTFQNGTTLTCTKDHKILTSDNKWVIADKLNTNQDKIKTGIYYPLSNIHNDMLLYKEWKLNNLDLITETNYNKTMAYMRLLGYLLSDGMLIQYRGCLFVGNDVDMNNIKSDIDLVCGKQSIYQIRDAGSCKEIMLPRKLSKEFQKLPGVLTGKRINQDALFPEFILQNDCPLPVLREFLGGLFGGNGHTTCYNKYDDKFTALGFSQTRTINKLESLKIYLNKLRMLLSKFGIVSNVQTEVEKKTSDTQKHYSVNIRINMEDIPKFESNIGFRYCYHKSFRLAVVSSYFKLKQQIIRQSNAVMNSYLDFRKEGYSCKQSVILAHEYIKDVEHIFNDHYSLLSWNNIRNRITKKQNNITELPTNPKYFLSPKQYLKDVNAYDFFCDDNKQKNEKTYSVKQNDLVLPTYDLRVVSKKNVGYKKVYDIQVEQNHSYIANGIIVHNCLMDCALCNKLIAKLQIIANNASMAIVCHVPLSYLFLRGQGVKIFSLVAKQCREENHLLPLLEKKQRNADKSKDKFKDKKEIEKEKEENEKEKKWENHINKLNFGDTEKHADGHDEDDEDDGYEGAIVFIPDPKVHYEPIPVLDYASLYPNSMILRNLSHEMFVNDPRYENIPGYRYHKISYKNNDGSITTCTFAEKTDGTKGIIPRILMGLLAARKKYKKMMEAENDPFTKEILNCLQNAYKVTANSLYGQTGASTSDICMKEIAASTTATGREMLLFSKYFVENYYAELINLALEGDKDAYLERAYELYKYYPTSFIVNDRAYDEKEKKLFDITHNIHVNTDENMEIPESKFCAGEIEYDIKIPLYNGKKKESKFYSKFEELFKTWKYENIEIYAEKFVNVLSKLKVSERSEFYNDLYKLTQNSKYGFYERQKNVLELMGFSKDEYLQNFKKSILALSKTDKELFLEIIHENISNMGYNGRAELFDKFYETIREVLGGYSCTPEIIYGDSVSASTPLILKEINSDNIVIKQIEELCDKYQPYDQFKCVDAIKYFERIIRKLFEPEVRENFNIIEIDLKNGNCILCDLDDIDLLNNEIDIDKFHLHVIDKILSKLPKKIQIMLSSCEIEHIDKNKFNNSKSNLRLNIKNLKIDNVDDLLNNIKNVLLSDSNNRYSKEQSQTDYLIWSGTKWTEIKRVIRHKTNKKMFKVVTNTSIIEVTEDHSLINSNGEYITPTNCNNYTYLMQSYPKINKLYNLDIINELISNDIYECTNYYLNCKKNGLNVKIEYDEIQNQYKLTPQTEPITDSNKIMRIIEINNNHEQYVYDLETENGHFHAGIGELIVKNTDSVFFKMGITDNETGELQKNKKALGMCIIMGIWASIMISTMLPSPMAQAYEKVLYPFIIEGKKRYVGNLYEKNIYKFKMKSMGIELKRRDNAPIVKICCSGIIDQILNHQSSEGACAFIRKILHAIITGNYKMDKFIITKTLKGNALTSIIPIDEKGKKGKSERQIENEKDPEERSYKNRDTIVHAVLADRMADRDPGNKPMSNDRIPYMYIEVDGEPELQGDRVEAPDYIIENNLKIDYLFYITNQIMKPCLKFLELIAENPEDIFKEFIIKEQNRKAQTMPICYYIQPKKNDTLVDPDENFEFVDFGEFYDVDSESKKPKRKNKSNSKSKTKQIQSEVNLDELFNDL